MERKMQYPTGIIFLSPRAAVYKILFHLRLRGKYSRDALYAYYIAFFPPPAARNNDAIFVDTRAYELSQICIQVTYSLYVQRLGALCGFFFLTATIEFLVSLAKCVLSDSRISYDIRKANYFLRNTWKLPVVYIHECYPNGIDSTRRGTFLK